MIAFDDILQQYGGDPASLLKFDVDGPELLPYLKATLTAIANGHPQSRIDDLLPWNLKPSS